MAVSLSNEAQISKDHFKIPDSIVMLTGCTSSGKTSLAKLLFLNRTSVFKNPDFKLQIHYAVMQKMYIEIQNEFGEENCILVKGFGKSDFDAIEQRDENDKPVWLLLDDLLFSLLKSNFFEELCCIYSHHKLANLCIINHGIYQDSNVFRMIRNQIKILVIFDSLRGRSSLQHLSSSLFKSNFLSDALAHSVSLDKYGFIVIDYNAPKVLTVRNNFPLPGQKIIVYLEK